MKIGVFFILLLLGLPLAVAEDGSEIQNNPDSLSEAVELYRSSTNWIRLAGRPPQNQCREMDFESADAEACTDFFDYACEAKEGTNQSTNTENTALMEAFNSNLNEVYEQGGAMDLYREAIQSANSGNRTPAFSESLQETVKNFDQAFCKDKADNEENRQRLATQFYQRFQSSGGPLYDPNKMKSIMLREQGELQDRCLEICKRNGGEQRSCREQCSDSANELSPNSMIEECRHQEGSVNRCLSEGSLRETFPFMNENGWSLQEMCQEMTNTLVKANRDFFSLHAEESWNNLPSERQQEIAQELNNQVFPQELRNSTQTMFNQVKEIGDSMVNHWSRSSGGMSNGLSENLNQVALNWDMPSDNMFDMLDRSTTMNAGYFHRSKQIRIYGGMLSEDPFQMMFVLAHEYGHALDRQIEDSDEDETISRGFSNISSCYTGRSYHANRNYGNRVIQRTPSAEHNQTGECTADFVGTEIFYNMLQNYTPPLSDEDKRKAVASTVMDCGDEGGRSQALSQDSSGVDPHLPWKDRSEGIIMAHPGMRELFGCSTNTNDDPYYCPGGRSSPNYIHGETP